MQLQPRIFPRDSFEVEHHDGGLCEALVVAGRRSCGSACCVISTSEDDVCRSRCLVFYLKTVPSRFRLAFKGAYVVGSTQKLSKLPSHSRRHCRVRSLSFLVQFVESKQSCFRISRHFLVNA